MKILVLEDDLKLAEHLREALKSEGYFVLVVSTSDEAKHVLSSNPPFNLVLMDRLLQGADSKHLVKDFRQRWGPVPIVVLSAISTPNERTELLDLGVDDYIGKPFSMRELLARIRAQLRRVLAQMENYIQLGNLILDTVHRTVSVEGRTEILPPREFGVLRVLAQDPKKIWSKEELLDYVWGQTAQIETNVVEATVTNVRKRLMNLGATALIKNMRNGGYWIAS